MSHYLQAIKDLANDPINYEAGWHWIAEAYSRDEINDLIKHAATLGHAIELVQAEVDFILEQESNTRFE
jgi:hypothetical protein